MSKPTDEEIIQILAEHGNCMTYFVANTLRCKFRSIDTAYVRRRLEKMEAAGKVRRVKSSYIFQICWESVQ